MKKVLLTAMTLVSIATSSVFGYYGANADWIDLITDGNQFRARTDKLGFVLGNGTIKGVFGFKSENGGLGAIFTPATIKDGTEDKYFANFTPTLSAGLAYTTEAFGIGIGYNYTYKHKLTKADGQNPPTFVSELDNFSKKGIGLSIHTPVVAMNFLNNNLRFVVPVQIAMKNGEKISDHTDYSKAKYMGISMDPQIRYYTGINAFNEIRLTVKYGMNKYTGQDEKTATASSFGIDFRTYFGAQAGDVALKPFLKVTYDTSLDATKNVGYGVNNWDIKAGSGITAANADKNHESSYASNPWKLEILPSLGLSAASDVVSIYVETALGYRAINTGEYTRDNKIEDDIQHALRWQAYSELSVRPIQDLEWYLEAEIGNGGGADDVYPGNAKGVQFASSTGLTWYLPSFQN